MSDDADEIFSIRRLSDHMEVFPPSHDLSKETTKFLIAIRDRSSLEFQFVLAVALPTAAGCPPQNPHMQLFCMI